MNTGCAARAETVDKRERPSHTLSSFSVLMRHLVQVPR